MKKIVLFVCLLLALALLGQAWNTPSTRNTVQALQHTVPAPPTREQHPGYPLVDINVQGQPTISVGLIEAVLAKARSPARGTGQALYELGAEYDIDPVFALAIFREESVFGTLGEARASLSLGNLRCIPEYPCRDGYAWFPNWIAGYDAFYKLIRVEYIGKRGRSLLSQIIPIYAPALDGNDPATYLAVIEDAIAAWRHGEVKI